MTMTDTGRRFSLVGVPGPDGKLPGERLREVLDAIQHRRGLFKTVGERLLFLADQNFEGQHSPDMTPWQALKAATIRARLRRGKAQVKILRETGALRGSLSFDARDDGLSVGSASPYGMIHQLGGTIEKKASSRYVVGRRFAKRDKEGGADVAIPSHTIRIPARPYLGVGKGQEEIIAEDVEAWLSR